MSLSDRARDCELLLTGLLAWTPPPHGTRLAAKPGPGDAKDQSQVRCENCGNQGRILKRKPCRQTGEHKRHGCRTCPVCEGSGWRRKRRGETGEDPMINPAAAASEASSRTEKRERAYALLLRLEQEERIREGAEARDELTDAIERRDRVYQGGSFLDAVRVLENMRVGSVDEQRAYSLLMRLRVYGEMREQEQHPVVRDAVGVALEMLAARMPDERIRVPAWLRPDEQVKKTSRWRGRTSAHADDRASRDASIVADLAAGIAQASVAARYGLTQGRVSQIAAQPVATQP